MKKLSRINLKTLSDKLSDREMKSVVGGYEAYKSCGYGSSGVCSGLCPPESGTLKSQVCRDRSPVGCYCVPCY
jgi:natural product precursor